MSKLFDVTVIVVNRNGGAYLSQCLTAVCQQTVVPKHIVVVDNDSTDGSIDNLESRFPAIRVIRADQNLGFAVANNLAINTVAATEWIVLLNPDAFPVPNWLEECYLATQTYPEYASYCCRMLKADDPTQLDGVGDCYHVSGIAWRKLHGCPQAGQAMTVKEVFSSCAAAAVYSKAAFIEAGGFDEAFFCYMEDVDLGYRLRLLGYRCLYVPSAVVYHVGSGITGKRSDFATYHGHRNLVWTYIKNTPGLLFWAYLPVHVIFNLVSVIWLCLRWQGRVIILAKKDAIRGIPRVWRQRQEIQANRKVQPKEIRKAMDKGLTLLTRFWCSPEN